MEEERDVDRLRRENQVLRDWQKKAVPFLAVALIVGDLDGEDEGEEIKGLLKSISNDPPLDTIPNQG
jgi:hypothetical protein